MQCEMVTFVSARKSGVAKSVSRTLGGRGEPGGAMVHLHTLQANQCARGRQGPSAHDSSEPVPDDARVAPDGGASAPVDARVVLDEGGGFQTGRVSIGDMRPGADSEGDDVGASGGSVSAVRVAHLAEQAPRLRPSRACPPFPEFARSLVLAHGCPHLEESVSGIEVFDSDTSINEAMPQWVACTRGSS